MSASTFWNDDPYKMVSRWVESNPDAMMKDKMNMFGSKGDPFFAGRCKWGQLKTGDFV